MAVVVSVTLHLIQIASANISFKSRTIEAFPPKVFKYHRAFALSRIFSIPRIYVMNERGAFQVDRTIYGDKEYCGYYMWIIIQTKGLLKKSVLMALLL